MSINQRENVKLRRVSSYTDFLSEEAAVTEVEFAGIPRLRGQPVDAELSATNIETALDFAGTQFSGDGNRHILLFTDGHETRGNALSAATRILGMDGQVHAVSMGKHRISPPSIIGVVPPSTSRVAYTSHALVRLQADQVTSVHLAIVDEAGIVVSSVEAEIVSERVVALPIMPKRKGIHRWKVLLRLKKGSNSPDGQADLWFHVDGPPELLLCDSEPLDLAPLKRILERLQFTCRITTLSAFPDRFDSLGQYDAILMSDLPAPRLSPKLMNKLKHYLSNGGGLIFLGGTHVSTKEWKESELEALLPIDFAPEVARVVQSIRPVHVCYVLDISGSMTEQLGVDLTGRPVSKLEMMKEAVLLSQAELPKTAIVSIVAFDMNAHIILNSVPVSQRKLIRQVVTHLPVGGGTNIVPGIQSSIDILNRSSIAKHMILLTDGVSSENPSDLLCSVIRNADVHLTSIAVGPDSNRLMLQHIADRTHGQFFYCPDAATIPRIFVKEARTIKTLAVMPRTPFVPRLGPDPDLVRGLSSDPIPILEAAVPATAKSSAH
ncbi:MAG: VWA domain-containing protein, partial [Phycisphaerae bacterium]